MAEKNDKDDKNGNKGKHRGRPSPEKRVAQPGDSTGRRRAQPDIPHQTTREDRDAIEDKD